MNYAIIKNGLVVNAIVWDGETPCETDGQKVALPDGAGIGWTYSDGQFIAPPEPVIPEPVEPVAPKP